MKLKNLGVVFDENLALKYQVAAVKKKAIGGLINIAKELEVYRQGVQTKTCSWFNSDTNRFL